ncbi:hypothetical protein HDU81_011360 [Chytriomyces hyalinus]|nr:hypothetical protein HDU81_011360 [Chytriomyces hyalinus]
MPAVTECFVSMSPQRQVEETARSDQASSLSDPSDPSAPSVQCTPVPRFLPRLRSAGCDHVSAELALFETVEDDINTSWWNSLLLDFATVPGATSLPASMRVAPYSQDFSTVSVQDSARFTRPVTEFLDPGLTVLGEEEFSVGPTFGTCLARNPDLGAGFMKWLVEHVFHDAVTHEIPLDVVFRTLAYLDLVFARSVNIVDWDLLDVYMVCVSMAESHCSQDLKQNSRQILQVLKSKMELDAFRMAACKRTALSRRILGIFEWNLGGPTLLDWLLVYFANFTALTKGDADALDFEKKLNIPARVLSVAVWVLGQVVLSQQVADLPYSIIAAGAFKKVAVDLMPNREPDACLEFTGYTDEQLCRVTRCIGGLECMVGREGTWSIVKDLLVQGGYVLVETEVVEPAGLQGDGEVADGAVEAEAEVVSA